MTLLINVIHIDLYEPKLVDQFNKDDSLFGMLLTTKTGGVGLVSDNFLVYGKCTEGCLSK